MHMQYSGISQASFYFFFREKVKAIVGGQKCGSTTAAVRLNFSLNHEQSEVSSLMLIDQACVVIVELWTRKGAKIEYIHIIKQSL